MHHHKECILPSYLMTIPNSETILFILKLFFLNNNYGRTQDEEKLAHYYNLHYNVTSRNVYEGT